jgi:hypothetical protein
VRSNARGCSRISSNMRDMKFKDSADQSGISGRVSDPT